MSEAICLALIFASPLVIPLTWFVIVPAVWLVEIMIGVRRIDALIYYIQLEFQPSLFCRDGNVTGNHLSTGGKK